MKIMILLLAIILGFSATVKKSAEDLKRVVTHHELNQYRHYPNLLPEIEVIASRI